MAAFQISYSVEMKLFALIILCYVLAVSRGNRSALFIIDVQDCFVDGGSLAVANASDVIPVINRIRRKHENDFSLVVFSQDSHCPDHVSFASQHPGKSAFEEVVLQYDKEGHLCYGSSVPSTYPHARNCSELTFNVPQMLWPDHCIQGITSGPKSFRIDPSVTRKNDDVIIPKGQNCEVDSYSMFYNNGGFEQTRLDSVLKKNNIDTVYVTGLALDYCVYYTSLDAKKLGYKTFTIADATRGVSPDTSVKAVADMVNKGVNVIQSSTLDTFLQVNIGSYPTISWTLTVLSTYVMFSASFI